MLAVFQVTYPLSGSVLSSSHTSTKAQVRREKREERREERGERREERGERREKREERREKREERREKREKRREKRKVFSKVSMARFPQPPLKVPTVGFPQ